MRIARRMVVLMLSEERGRDQLKPITNARISQWAADLGFEAGQRGFTQEQMDQLRSVNLHYARGGSRRELLEQLKQSRRKECTQ